MPSAAVLGAALRLALRRTDKTGFKGVFLQFLRDVPEPEAEIERFWDANMTDIHRWYLAQRRADDVVVTASPVSIVRPACARLGIAHVLGSPVDVRTGDYHGVNCHGAEKARVFRSAFPDARVERFYSDALGDAPLARLASEAFLVKGEHPAPWPSDARDPKADG